MANRRTLSDATILADWQRIATALRHEAVQYLALRRALGFKLVDTERLLIQFITHLKPTGTTRITTYVAVTWGRQSMRWHGSYLRRVGSLQRPGAAHILIGLLLVGVGYSLVGPGAPLPLPFRRGG